MPDREGAELFSPDFIRRLEGLSLALRRTLSGHAAGARRSAKKGVSVEFADFRSYVPGDDPRVIDWKALGRLDKLFVKLFMEEQEASLVVAVDCSSSMGFGEPVKFWTARRLAGALAFLGLDAGDRVTLVGLGSGGASPRLLGPLRGRASVRRCLEFLTALPCGGATDLEAELKKAAASAPIRSLAIVISDLLSPTGYAAGLKLLSAASRDLGVIQILSPEEIDPLMSGDLKLVDSETGESVEVSLTPDLLERYRREVGHFRQEAAHFCSSRGISFLSASSEEPAEGLLVRWLPSLGVSAG